MVPLSLPNANLRNQETLEWRKWTQGGCSFLLLSAQFWSSCHAPETYQRLQVLVTYNRDVTSLVVCELESESD